MNRKKIGILFGGSSSEYGISLKSAYGIISHIDRKRYEPVLLGITILWMPKEWREKKHGDTTGEAV